MHLVRYFTFLIFCLLSILASCIKINLERREIITFTKPLPSSEILGPHQFVPLYINQNDQYWIGGVDEKDQSLISIYSSEGDLINQVIGTSPGEITAIQPSLGTDEVFLVVATTGSDSYLAEINPAGQRLRLDSLRQVINAEIGLVEEVEITDLASTFDKDGWIVTGRLKQSLGEPRLLIGKLTEALELEWIRTYQENYTGRGLGILENGEIAILAFNTTNKQAVGLFDDQGIIKWFRSLPNTITSPHSNLAIAGDTIWTIGSRPMFSAADALVIAYDLNGNVLLERTYGLPAIEESGAGIALIRNGGLLIFYSENSTYHLACTDIGTGLVKWSSTFEGMNVIRPLNCSQVSDFGILGLGFEMAASGEKSYRLIKTDEVGKIRE